MRSRTVSRPWSRCRLTLSTPPISRANASRRARSSSSGFQFICVLRHDFLYLPDCPILQAIVEQIAFRILQQAGDGGPAFGRPDDNPRDTTIESAASELL